MQINLLDYLKNSVAKYPDKIVFEDENRALSYRQTDIEAKAISDAIISRIGFQHNQPILIFLPKSIETIVAMFGALYSGNFYTPVDIRFPDNKLQDMFETLDAKVVVTYKKFKEQLVRLGLAEEKLIFYEDLDFASVNYKTNENGNIDTDLAYVFFTSGSTGKPKGVTLTHRNIISYIEAMDEIFPYNEKTVSGNQAPLHFDITTHDIYLTLKKSAKLVIIPEKFFIFPTQLVTFLKQSDINTLYWGPAAFMNTVKFDALKDIVLDKIKNVITGGEFMPVKYINYLKSKMPNLDFICNVYGPTEATVNVSYYEVKKEFREDENLPLGKALKNVRLIILDEENRKITQPGNIGELCILGSQLSPGYYKDAEKTKKAFIQSPLHNNYKELLYKTGDLASYNEAGEILCHGRTDNFIKHMGHSVELGEIEVGALSVDFVANAICLYDKEKSQIALLYVANQQDVTDRDLRRALAKILPKHMVPTIYFQLDDFPLNQNGKVDRVKLRKEFLEVQE